MKQIDKPTRKVVDILTLLKADNCEAAAVLDMESAVEILAQREILYEEKVQDNRLFEVPREQVISLRVDKAKMVSYYNYRILQKPGGRTFYDQVFMSAPNNICPYCTINSVKTIDHYLPKSEYPSYSITPVNLVPSCTDCNFEKKLSYPTTSNNQTFHPYFDKVDNELWIKAELMHTTPLSFQFEVIRPGDWDELTFDRAKSHFKSYNINQLFSNEANRELRGMQEKWNSLFIKDRSEFKAYLEEIYSSCRNGLGLIDWKTLMYQELSTNEWFLEGCPESDFFT